MKLGKKEFERINQTLRELNIDRDSRHINCFKFASEGHRHRRMKFKVCEELYEQGKPFLCEATANGGKQRFDVVDLLDGEVIEIDFKSTPNREKIQKTRRVKVSAEPQAERDH